jgi:hypothetical protein
VRVKGDAVVLGEEKKIVEAFRYRRSKMIRRPKTLWIAMGLLTVFVNVLILFVLIPKASGHIRGLYSADQCQDGYDQLATNLAAGNGYRFYPNTAHTVKALTFQTTK